MHTPSAKSVNCPEAGGLTVTFQNGSKIYIDGADNPDGLRGSYYDGVVPDEMAQMKTEVWGEVIRPMLSDRNGWCLFIGSDDCCRMA